MKKEKSIEFLQSCIDKVKNASEEYRFLQTST